MFFLSLTWLFNVKLYGQKEILNDVHLILVSQSFVNQTIILFEISHYTFCDREMDGSVLRRVQHYVNVSHNTSLGSLPVPVPVFILTPMINNAKPATLSAIKGSHHYPCYCIIEPLYPLSMRTL